ncbi:MAG: hypothetical protein FWC79_01330 [Oscillospiraceae bacterium]|nr:hypothetical protein [Oscillospiraceae bacterium]
MKDIYIVITYTGTYLSKAIKLYTKNTYTHVSIALDKELEELYSFGRHYSYTLFPAGFVHEGIDFGTFKRFKKTKAVVFSKTVTEEQYDRIQHVIKQMEKDKEKYRFNIIGMAAVSLGKQVERENYFYCAEFVRYILSEAGVETEELPKIVKPQDFTKLKGINSIYEGFLQEYSYKENEKHIKCG